MLGIALFGPIDRSPINDRKIFTEMAERVKRQTFTTTDPNSFSVAWSKVNITPASPFPMAGYKPRRNFESVHDSLYARLMEFEISGKQVVIINVDLLIFPPLLQKAIQERITSSKIFLYLSATHTHNGVGGWDNSIVGKFVSGKYHEEWINQTANKIAGSIRTLKTERSSIRYWEATANELVVNRIAYSKGEKDGVIRGLQITKSDSSKAILFSFSAHPTSITKKSLSLSADYPGKVIELIEREFDFGMFVAGMVGSHSFENFAKENFELVDLESELVKQKIDSRKILSEHDSMSVSMAHIPIVFGPSQVRISKNWKVRDWVLKSLLGGLKGELTYLRLGDIVMIGTPCDFSGEIFVRSNLEQFASRHNRHLMITSFNGNYVGYITYDGHYDSIKNAETREMNWVGPYYGEYFSSMIKQLIEKDTITF